MNPEKGRGHPKSGEDEASPLSNPVRLRREPGLQLRGVAEASSGMTFTSIPDSNERSMLKMKMPRPTTYFDQSLRVSPGTCIFNTQ